LGQIWPDPNRIISFLQARSSRSPATAGAPPEIAGFAKSLAPSSKPTSHPYIYRTPQSIPALSPLFPAPSRPQELAGVRRTTAATAAPPRHLRPPPPPTDPTTGLPLAPPPPPVPSPRPEDHRRTSPELHQNPISGTAKVTPTCLFFVLFLKQNSFNLVKSIVNYLRGIFE
jgi:hypothetical protein